MGRRKKSSSRKRTPKKTVRNDMLGGFLVVIGLVLFVFLIFSNIGVVADIFKSLLKGLFGIVSYVIPATLIVVGVYSIYSDKRIKISNGILKGVYLAIVFSTFACVFFTNSFTMFESPMRNIINTYNDAIAGNNFYGATGYIISSLFVKIVGVIASRIIVFFLALFSLLCVLHISLKQVYIFCYNTFAHIYNGICDIIEILFGTDEEEEKEKQVQKSRRQARKEKMLQEERLKMEQEMAPKMKEKGIFNAEENLIFDKSEQVEFDFNKLGGKPSEKEIQAKQQRDEFFQKQKEQKEDKSVKEVMTLDHTKHVEEDNYEFPPISLLGVPKNGEVFDKKAIQSVAVKLQKTLASFGVEAKVTNITKGPTVTRYELTPNTGVKVSRIVKLSDDIALNLAARSIRIEAPIPGKSAVGIEVPNEVAESVYLREVIESDSFKEHSSKLAFALGKDAAGEIIVGDIAKMPHTLIAGSTGSGKSVCINSLIVSILYKAKPSEVKMILIDPKMVELSGYNGIPHLLIPVVIDPKKAAGALNWAVQEMVNRYKLFAEKGVKDIKGYNKVMEKEQDAKLPQIVIIVDELADLMMVAPNDVEDAICRLAQMARAAGMHLVIATQRPSVDVITGIIKANIPSRIAFTVSSQVDSRTILDMAGAEKLLGKGDMLYFPVGETKPHRVQGAFISEKEIEKIVEYIKEHTKATYSEDIIESIEKNNSKDETGSDVEDDADALLNDAIDLVVDMGQASASMLQRRFKIGYSRAGRIVDQMEARGLISGYEGSKPRQVLISKAEWQELKLGKKPDDEGKVLQNQVEEVVPQPIEEVQTSDIETSSDSTDDDTEENKPLEPSLQVLEDMNSAKDESQYDY